MSSTASSSECDERTKEIKTFLTKQLKLTPRRVLFEEFEKISRLEENEVDEVTDCSNTIESQKKFDLSTVREISEFRKNHPECMSNVSRQRLQRAKEREQELLHHPCAHYYVESKTPITKTEVTSSKPRKKSTTEEFRMKTVQFAPDNSLALAHQKFKC